MADVEEVQVVVAHRERATLRVGDVFLKIDGDQSRTDVEVEAMDMAPIPTPEVLWRKPPGLALPALPGRALRRRRAPRAGGAHGPASASRRRRRPRHGPLPAPPHASCMTRRCRHGRVKA